MKQLLKPGLMPRAKVGDFENALALLVATGADKSTKAYLGELHAATAAYDKAKDDAQAAERKVTTRESEAQAAEADATLARQLLADETAAATAALGEREIAVADRENLAKEAEQSQVARDKELTRREDHLREAGVRGF